MNYRNKFEDNNKFIEKISKFWRYDVHETMRVLVSKYFRILQTSTTVTICLNHFYLL